MEWLANVQKEGLFKEQGKLLNHINDREDKLEFTLCSEVHFTEVEPGGQTCPLRARWA